MSKSIVIAVGLLLMGFLAFFVVNASLSNQLTGGSAVELPSAGNVIEVGNLQVFEDRVIIEVENATISKFANTNSMDPTLDEGSHGIEMKPQPGSLKVGDIVSYYSSEVDGYVIHRIIEVDEDKEGTFYIVKGDNNQAPDPKKVRFEQIEGVLIGILY